jgi:hypothetical protein
MLAADIGEADYPRPATLEACMDYLEAKTTSA